MNVVFQKFNDIVPQYIWFPKNFDKLQHSKVRSSSF